MSNWATIKVNVSSPMEGAGNEIRLDIPFNPEEPHKGTFTEFKLHSMKQVVGVSDIFIGKDGARKIRGILENFSLPLVIKSPEPPVMDGNIVNVSIENSNCYISVNWSYPVPQALAPLDDLVDIINENCELTDWLRQ